MSVRPASRSARISSTPSAVCTAVGPFGIELVSVCGLRTNPIAVISMRAPPPGMDACRGHARGCWCSSIMRCDRPVREHYRRSGPLREHRAGDSPGARLNGGMLDPYGRASNRAWSETGECDERHPSPNAARAHGRFTIAIAAIAAVTYVAPAAGQEEIHPMAAAVAQSFTMIERSFVSLADAMPRSVRFQADQR